MSKASHLVHWDSAVGKLAAFLNPDLRSHYLPGPDEYLDGGRQLTADNISRLIDDREEQECTPRPAIPP